MAGAACAAGLRSAGLDVTVFDRSDKVGGRMATHHADWIDARGVTQTDAFDHGCGQFSVTGRRFDAVVKRAVNLGFAAHWRQHVYATFPTVRTRQVVVPTPNMQALCIHLLGDTPLRLGHTVRGVRRTTAGWLLHVFCDDIDERLHGPFDRIVLAMPALQAARLLDEHEPAWAQALSCIRTTPCWTLTAVTDDLDWPWDAALVEQGALGWIARNDRKPGRPSLRGLVPWVAHATPDWSLAHLDDDPVQVTDALLAALAQQLSSTVPIRWHHSSVHQWRQARHGAIALDGPDCLWDEDLGVGVCGDAFGLGNVEAAWRSGDELADAISASCEANLFETGTRVADTPANTLSQ